MTRCTFLLCAILFALCGAPPCVWAKVDVSQKTASGIFSITYEESVWVDGAGTLDIAGRASGWDYELASGLRKWPSEDPIGESGGPNLYAYVGNGPIGSWDPLGLAPGDFFTTFKSAYEDALQYAYDMSKKSGKEYGGKIVFTALGFMYDGNEGGTGSVCTETGKLPNGTHIPPILPVVAYYHSHGPDTGFATSLLKYMGLSNENFSSAEWEGGRTPGDKELGDARGKLELLVTPTGVMKVYYPDPQKKIQGKVEILGKVAKP